MPPWGNGTGGTPVPTRARSRRPTVLLTTEGTFPHVPGGVGTWCESLIRGLPEVEFVVWALSPNPFLAHGRSFPANMVRLIDLPMWTTDDPGRVRRAGPDAVLRDREPMPRSIRDATAGAHRPSSRDLEREFVPLLQAFLSATSATEFDAVRFAALLVEMRDHFRRWDHRRTWRSRAAWEVFRGHMLSRDSRPPADVIDAEADHALAEGRAARAAVPGDEPTIGEAVEALRWLVRALAPLTVEVPPEVDLVHSSAAGLCAVPGILAKTERGTPLFLTEHALYVREHFLAMHTSRAPFHLKRFTADVVGAVARTAYHLADRIAPVCRFNARWELAYGAPRSRIGVIHPGVDEYLFAPNGVPRSRRPTVVQVSPIDPLKDQVTLLRVADLVRREIPDVLFLHFGDVADRDYWAQVRRMHRDRMLEDTVRFMGPAGDVPEVLNQADVALVTSSSEAFPLSVLEALMCGVPVVTTAVGGIEEALNGAGFTAPPRDPDALANAVAAILGVAPDQRARMATAARHHAMSRFRLSTFLDAHRDWYEALTGISLRPVETPEEVMRSFEEVPDAVPADVQVPDGIAVMVPEPEPPEEPEPVEAEPEEPVEEAEPKPIEAEDEPEPEFEIPEGPPPAAEEWAAAAWRGSEESAARGQHPREPEEPAEPTRILHSVPPPETSAEPEREPVMPERVPEPESEPEPRELEPAMAGAVAGASAGPFGAADLEAGLSHPDPFMRANAVSRVRDPWAAEALTRALSDEHAQVRREAVRALGRVNGPRAGGFLADAVAHDPSAEVREEAVAALAALLSRPTSAERDE